MSGDGCGLERVGTVLWVPDGGLPAQIAVIGDLVARWDLLPPWGDGVGVRFPARGPVRQWGDERAMAVALGERLVGAGARAPGVAVAPGRLLSWAMSRQARQGAEPAIVPDTRAREARARLPVAVLSAPGGPAALDPSFVERLVRLGLRRLGDVAALRVGDLVGRFGEPGRQAHRWAVGAEPPVPVSVASPEVTVEFEFDPPVNQVDTVVFAGRRLADRLDVHMRRRGDVPTVVRIAIDTEHGECVERLWCHTEGLRATALVDRVRWQLQAWEAGPVALLRFTVIEVAAERGRQAGWWGGEAHGDERAAGAVARVAGLIGHEAVTRFRWRGGRDPSDRYERLPASPTEPPPPQAPTAEAPWPGGLPSPSPARLWRDPLPIEVRDASGDMVRVDGRGELSAAPARVVTARTTSSEVVAWAGPWPLEERWWRPAEHRRRARLQLITADGSALLVHLEQRRWWLRAVYC